MSRMFVGFLLGVIAASAGFLLFAGQRGDSPLLQPGSESATVPSASVPAAKGAVLAPTADAVEESNGKPASSTLPPDFITKVGKTIPAPSENQPGSSVDSAIAQASRVSAGEYSAEIAEVLGRNVPEDLHTRFETEDREASWANYMEGQFAAYFADRPVLAQFNIPLIHCRTSVCEIHAIGYGPDAYAVWTGATAGIQYETWHDFKRLSVSTKDVAPGVLGIVLIMAKPDE